MVDEARLRREVARLRREPAVDMVERRVVRLPRRRVVRRRRVVMAAAVPATLLLRRLVRRAPVVEALATRDALLLLLLVPVAARRLRVRTDDRDRALATVLRLEAIREPMLEAREVRGPPTEERRRGAAPTDDDLALPTEDARLRPGKEFERLRGGALGPAPPPPPPWFEAFDERREVIGDEPDS